MRGIVTFKIDHIYTFLVEPRKGVKLHHHSGGTKLSGSGKLINLLTDIFDKAEDECDIEIRFLPSDNGAQQNECRDEIIKYIEKASIDNARKIATRLELCTTQRSGLGLLFLIDGSNATEKKFVISRFPADSGILADQKAGKLDVKFLERVFMKNSKTYKSVVYRHKSLATGFWQGSAIDKQISSNEVRISNYWISEFLLSDFKQTSAAGTRMLAQALKAAGKKAQAPEIENEIASAATLAKGLAGQNISIADFATKFSLSSEAVTLLKAELKSPKLFTAKFKFDYSEFGAIVKFRTVKLANGAKLSASAENFDNIFKVTNTNPSGSKRRYETEGTVDEETVGKGR